MKTPVTDIRARRAERKREEIVHAGLKVFAQDNAGHDLNAVLTDDERHAIIEYLKTL